MPVEHLQDFRIGKRTKALKQKAQEMELEHATQISNSFQRFTDWCTNRIFKKAELAAAAAAAATSASGPDGNGESAHTSCETY